MRAVRRLSEAGIPFDQKPFVPHITLGRKPILPAGIDLSGIQIPPAVMTVSDVFLYRSDRGENGMVYSVIGKSGCACHSCAGTAHITGIGSERR